jgi:hypothetical protein
VLGAVPHAHCATRCSPSSSPFVSSTRSGSTPSHRAGPRRDVAVLRVERRVRARHVTQRRPALRANSRPCSR